MFIFRLEHRRSECNHYLYGEGGESITGHGPASGCGAERPNFGHRGNPPRVPMMVHERCAVTAEQFADWISAVRDYSCRDTTYRCDGYSNYCNWCTPVTREGLGIPADWDIVSYWVSDDAEGIDWRYDENQVVFNPERAQHIGPVTIAHLERHAGQEIKVLA